MNAAKTCLLRFLAGDDGVTWGAILWDTGAPAPQGLWEAGAHHTGGQVGGGQVGGGPAGGRDGDGGDAAPQGSARLLAGYTFTLGIFPFKLFNHLSKFGTYSLALSSQLLIAPE